eukprot:8312573-Ditylum_brightwellii.AAC.1
MAATVTCAASAPGTNQRQGRVPLTRFNLARITTRRSLASTRTGPLVVGAKQQPCDHGDRHRQSRLVARAAPATSPTLS